MRHTQPKTDAFFQTQSRTSDRFRERDLLTCRTWFLVQSTLPIRCPPVFPFSSLKHLYWISLFWKLKRAGICSWILQKEMLKGVIVKHSLLSGTACTTSQVLRGSAKLFSSGWNGKALRGSWLRHHGAYSSNCTFQYTAQLPGDTHRALGVFMSLASLIINNPLTTVLESQIAHIYIFQLILCSGACQQVLFWRQSLAVLLQLLKSRWHWAPT